MDSSVDTIIQKARHIASLRTQGWSKTRLAREVGLGINGLVRLNNDDFNPKAANLRKLEAAIKRIEKELKRDCMSRT